MHVFGISQAKEKMGLPKLSLKQKVIGFSISAGIAATFAILVSYVVDSYLCSKFCNSK